MKKNQDPILQDGNVNKDIRTTVIINETLIEKIKAISYWERLKIKDVVNSALQEYVARYEKKNGSVKPIPKK